MRCKLELEVQRSSILNVLYNLMTESLSELVSSVIERLATYSLIRTFSIIRTIKSISEDIIKKDRTTLIKNIQRLTEIEDLLFNQLELFPNTFDRRRSLTAIIDSTLLKTFQRKSLFGKAQMELCKEMLRNPSRTDKLLSIYR